MKYQLQENGLVTLTDQGIKEVEHSPMWNEDLRPTTTEEHNWKGWHFASLWIGMCICIPTYTMASGMIGLGMNWWQAVGTIFLANIIVMIPILLNAHAGTKFGIPYPVFARVWFGSKGAHIPALSRALIAAGWFGINAWIGGTAIDTLIVAFSPGFAKVAGHTMMVFLVFWVFNMFIAYRGPQAIRVLGALAAPILGVLSIGLLIWAYNAAGGLGPMLSAPSKFHSTGEFLKIFGPSLTGGIAFWATLALNIPDFCRYAKSQKSQAVSQAFAMPLTMGIFSFIGVAVTSATVVIFGQAIWDPVKLLSHFSPFVIVIGAIGVVLSSLTINIAANIVAPARALENLWPRKITFGIGAIITGLFAIAMQPWAILGNFGNYIFGWLGTLGALLGPIDGIAIADYWLARRCKLHLIELYKPNGRYSYAGGFNKAGVYALIAGLAASSLGMVIPGLYFLWENAWTVGLFTAGIVYWALMKRDKSLLSDEEYNAITSYQNNPVLHQETAAAKEERV
jgi:nucleobase:cation symporter-1, NCS1 family